jgi:hypothetical protein
MINWTGFATGNLYEIAKQAHDRVSLQPANIPHNDALVAVLFSAATLESFMSQAVFMAETWSHLHPKIAAFASFIGELDTKVGASLKTKYNMARWIICGAPFDQGKLPYQDFDLLVDLRNAITHLKPDKLSSDKTRKLLSCLKNRNLMPDYLVSDYDPAISEQRAIWVHYVSTAKVAKWACNTAAEMIQAFWRDASEDTVKDIFRIHANASHYLPIQ